uniref:Uncharacterized protein n=1 Tax=Avena sativa TaxID=4498 RepID=A0ACD5YJH9_AVESA
MTPVVHCSVGSVSLFHIGSFRPSREIQIRRFRGSERYSRVTSPSHHGLLQPQTAFRLISVYKTSWSSANRLRTLSAAAVETDVAVEGSSSPSGETSSENSEATPGTAETTEQAEAGTRPASSAPKVGRNVRKSEMPPLKEEDLVPGASFTGKVRSIKPFGVFVDIGAFTEGLVHISRVSDGFVEDISTLFTVGQEVSVRLVEANKETRRISLTMRTGGDYVKEAPNAASDGKSPTSAAPRSSPRQTKDFKKIDEAKYTRGKSLIGIVKNTNRTGSFVTLPDGDEGFLPREEEAAALFTLIGHSALEVGQEITVKVLNVSRGQVNLTMKGGDDDEDELASLNTNLMQGWSRGTNAFELAFRRSKEISAFLDQREKITVPEVQAEVETESPVAISEVDSKVVDKLVQPPAVSPTEVESKEEDSSSGEAVTGAIEEITPVAEEPEASVEEVPATASTESVDKEAALETGEVAASSEKTTEVAAAGAGEASTTTGQQ